MVAAVHYFATPHDHASLLDFLGQPASVALCPWPVVQEPPVVLSRDTALLAAQVMVVRNELGPPRTIRPGHDAMAGTTKAGIFNRLNWDRLRPTATEGLVDSNTSPVLLWTPGTTEASEITVSTIGSQADAMRAISVEYERWANRVMNWVRRSGTKVWGSERGAVRPDLDIDLPFVNSVVALPEALGLLEAGRRGRQNRRS